MAIPAHKTEYFIIENSNLQKKANTAGKQFGLPIFIFSLNVWLFTKEKLLHSEFYINPDLNPISAHQLHHQHISLLQADNHLSA